MGREDSAAQGEGTAWTKVGERWVCHTQGHDYGHRLSLSRSLAVEVKDRGDCKGTEATALRGINYIPANLPFSPFIFVNSPSFISSSKKSSVLPLVGVGASVHPQIFLGLPLSQAFSLYCIFMALL